MKNLLTGGSILVILISIFKISEYLFYTYPIVGVIVGYGSGILIFLFISWIIGAAINTRRGPSWD